MSSNFSGTGRCYRAPVDIRICRVACALTTALAPGTMYCPDQPSFRLMDHVVMADVVEIHVPLVPAPGTAPGAYPFPWIDQVEDFLVKLEDEGTVEVYDDGEECGDSYLFFLAGANEASLLAAASRVATLGGVPAGAFAVVTDDGAPECGMGRRVDLPVS
jgi:hypothetical protein